MSTPLIQTPIRPTGLSLSGLTFAGLVLLLTACTPEKAPPHDAPLEIEEVSLPPDAMVDPTLDEKEARRETANLSGQLPSSYPSELPTYPGASVTDLGESEPWIEFLVAKTTEAVARGYSAQLQNAGWTIDGGSLTSDGTSAVVRAGDLSVSIQLEAKGPSTRIVVHY